MTAARLRLSITALNKEIKIIKLFQFWAGSRTVQVSVKLMADCSTLTDQRLESFVDRRQQFWSAARSGHVDPHCAHGDVV